jgi:hypothetical protein
MPMARWLCFSRITVELRHLRALHAIAEEGTRTAARGLA